MQALCTGEVGPASLLEDGEMELVLSILPKRRSRTRSRTRRRTKSRTRRRTKRRTKRRTERRRS